jgi:hypothetical protein
MSKCGPSIASTLLHQLAIAKGLGDSDEHESIGIIVR